MRHKINTLFTLSSVLALGVFGLATLGFAGRGVAQAPASAQPLAITIPAPPKTAKVEVKEVVQGVEIADPYRWLEDQNSPETRAWIQAQNAYTDSIIPKLPGREALKEKVAAFVKIDFMSAPVVRNGRYFLFKRRADQDQAVLYMRQGLEGKDEVLVDPMANNPEHTVTVNLMSVSQDGKLIAYAVRHGGADEVEPHLLNVDSHSELADKFPKARYSGFALLPDKTGVYFTKLTPEGPRVFFHKMGTEAASDAVVFGNGYGPEKIVGSGVSDDGHNLEIVVSYGSAAERTEIYFQDLVKKGPVVPVVTDLKAASFPQIEGGRMFVRTNWKAAKWRIMEVDLKNPAPEHWREVIPEGADVMDGFSLVGGMLAVHVTHDVVGRVKLFDTNGKMVRKIALPTLGSLSGLGGFWDSKEAFFSFASFYVPPDDLPL